MAINFLQSTKLPDDVKLQFGDSTDFEIYHDATTNQNKITSLLGRQLLINSASFVVNNAGDTQNMIIATDGGAVSLYCAGSLKLATTSVGSTITGGLTTTASSSLAGANMSAGIAMGTNAITGMADPSSAQDAATKAYVDGALPTVNNATITINTSTGLDGGFAFTTNQSSNETANISLDLSEFQDSGTLVGSDHLISLDGNVESKSTISSIPLSIFNNNAGFVTSSGVTSVATSAPITGGTITGTGTIGITQSSGSANGYLSSTDWTTFNNKTSNTGTVTSVATGTGLTGGTITGSGTISVDNTVVLTNNTQTISGGKTFSDVLTATSDIDMESGGDILLSATGGIQIDGDPGVGKFLKKCCVRNGVDYHNSKFWNSYISSDIITNYWRYNYRLWNNRIR